MAGRLGMGSAKDLSILQAAVSTIQPQLEAYVGTFKPNWEGKEAKNLEKMARKRGKTLISGGVSMFVETPTCDMRSPARKSSSKLPGQNV